MPAGMDIRSDVFRILHVDDDPDQLRFAKRFLEEADPGLRVDGVISPLEALEKLGRQSYDCIVSDYLMSEMSGIVFCHRVKKRFQVPFIIYTGRGSEEVAEAAFAAGVDDYVRKDPDPSHYMILARRIRAAVEKHRMEQRLRESEAQYRGFIEASRDGVMVLHSTEILFANLQAAKLHGFNTIKELLRVGPLERVLPEDREQIIQRASARQRGESVSPLHQFRVRLPDGTIRYLETSSTLIEYGGRRAILSFVRDVSDRVKSRERLEALHRHAAKLALADDIQKVCETTLDVMESVLGFEYAAFLVVEGDRLNTIGTRGAPLLDIDLPLDGRGITVKAARERRTVLINDLRGNPDFIRGSTDSLSELAVPVLVDGETVAVLNVESLQLNAFTEEDRRLLEIFAEHVAATIRRIQLTESGRLYQAKLDALHSSALKLTTAESAEEVYTVTIEILESVLGFQWAGIGIVDNDTIRYIKYVGFNLTENWTLPLDGPGVTVRAVKTGRSQLVPDVRRDPDYVTTSPEVNGEPRRLSDLPVPPRLLSELAVPIIVDGKVEAVINLEHREANAFTEEDKRLMEILAAHMAAALTRLRRLQDRRKYEERLEALHRHISQLSRAESLEEVVEHTLDAMEAALGFDTADFLTIEDGLIRIKGGRGIVPSIHELPLDGPGIVVKAANTGRTVLVPDIREEPVYVDSRPIRENGEAAEILSELATPVMIEGETVAVLNLESTQLNAFTENDRRLLEILASHVASALSNIRHLGAIKESETRYRTVVEGASDGIIIIAEGTRIIYANKNAVEIVGYDNPEEVIDLHVTDFILPEDWKRILKQHPQQKNGVPRPTTYQFKIRRRDGRVREIEASATQITYFEEPAFLSFFRDVTERNRLKQELEKERLRRTKAEELERIRSNFIASVSHELRTPLNSIIGFSDLLLEGLSGELTEKQRENILMIRQGGETLLRFINDLLELAKLDAKAVKLHCEIANIRGLVDEVVRELIPLIAKKGLYVKKEVAHDLEAEVDPIRVKQVLRNLLDNAIKFTDAGGITIRAEKTNADLHVSVSDTGIGIPENKLPTLFDRYAEMDPNIQVKYGGTGLGLRICKEIVTLHGGQIWAESCPGKGSTFHFKIPLSAIRDEK